MSGFFDLGAMGANGLVLVGALLAVAVLGAVAYRNSALARLLSGVEAELRQALRQNRTVLDSAGDGIFGVDRSGRILFVNPAAASLLGWRQDELIGADAHALFHHARADGSLCDSADCGVNSVLSDGQIRHERADVYWRKDGTPIAVELTIAPLLDDGRVSGAVVVFRDETERRRTEDQLRLSSRFFESSPDGIVILDRDRRIRSINPALTVLTGHTADDLVGRPAAMLISEPPGRHQLRLILAALHEDGRWEGELVGVRAGGDIFPAWVRITVCRDDKGKIVNYICIFSDMTEEKATRERVEYLSRYDALTGLPNQTMLSDYFAIARTVGERSGGGTALICCNLDNFKHINDTLGREAGDDLLKQIARRLRGCVAIGTGDVVGRSSGDEFLVVLVDVPGREAIDASIYAMRAVLSVPFEISGHSVSMTASMGVARHPEDGATFDELFRYADAAVFHAKQAGRNVARYFISSMMAFANERLTLKHDLRLALDRDELVLHYQPLIDLATRRVIGGEALVRWQSPKHGFLPPGRFIPIAEETGLIVSIGHWVLREVCRQGQALRCAGFPDLRLAVNISPLQLRRDGFASQVAEILDETGLPAEWLELELTESMLITDAEQTLQVIHDLKDLGVHLAIDDFGTGYSCLAYLSRLRTDKLKIDRSFVTDMATNPESEAIITTIIRMAQSMRMTTLAEGVETEAQAEFLRTRGCKECQGYLFGRPVPLDDFKRLAAR